MKKKLRKYLLDLRNEYSAEELLIKNEIILNKLQNLKEFKKSKIILSFMPINSEINVLKLLSISDKLFAFPICNQKNMKFYTFYKKYKKSYYDENLFNLDKFKIRIPKLEFSYEVDYKDAFVIVPMLGFFENMHRIGYGGGFYDRFFENNINMNLFKCGICYEFLNIDNLLKKYCKNINNKYDIKFIENTKNIDNNQLILDTDVKLDLIVTDEFLRK